MLKEASPQRESTHMRIEDIFAIRVAFRVRGEHSETARNPLSWCFERTTPPTSMAEVISMLGNDDRNCGNHWGSHNLIIEKVEALHGHSQETELNLV